MSHHPHPWLATLAGQQPARSADDALAAAAKQVHDAQWQADLDAPSDEARRRRLRNLYEANRPREPDPSTATVRSPTGGIAGGGGRSGLAMKGRRWGLLGLAALAGLLSAWLILRLSQPSPPAQSAPAWTKGGAASAASGMSQSREASTAPLNAHEQRVATPQPQAAAQALATRLASVGISAQIQPAEAGSWQLDAAVTAAQRDALQALLAPQGLLLPEPGARLQVRFIPM